MTYYADRAIYIRSQPMRLRRLLRAARHRLCRLICRRHRYTAESLEAMRRHTHWAMGSGGHGTVGNGEPDA